MRAAFAGMALLLAQANAGNVVYTFEDVDPKHAMLLINAPCKTCGMDDHKVDVWGPDALCKEMLHGVEEIPRLDIRGGEELVQLAQELGLESSIMIPNLAELLARERPANATAEDHTSSEYHTVYHTLPQIRRRMKWYAFKYGRAAKHTNAGKSYDGRDIPALRFGSSAKKDVVLLQCGIHAREWISPATCMYLIERLLDEYTHKREPVYSYLKTVEIYAIPVLNPDGYDFTWWNNRYWRKNRRDNGDGTFGVDLNRNWDDHWGLCGSTNETDAQTYRGTAPFSEPEARAVAQLFTNLKERGHRIQSGIDVHSYSQLILRPYGWTLPQDPCPGAEEGPCVPDNNERLTELGEVMKQAIFDNGGMNYTNQPAADLYCAAGNAGDWFGTHTEQAHGYSFELRDTGYYGFILPSDQIIPTGNEIYHAYLAYLQDVINGLE